LLIKHSAVILVPFGPGIVLKDRGGIGVITVAQCDNILAYYVPEFASSYPANSNYGNIQPVAGRSMPQTGNCNTGNYRKGKAGGTDVLYK